jgi:hypothetical protein
LQVGCEKVTTGSVRRAITCLCFSQDGNWLFAGTASGDVLTVNVARRAVQVGAQLWAGTHCSLICRKHKRVMV